MKAHTIGFKSQIKELGKELKGIISYNNVVLEDEIYSITPHYNANILKSVMKQLDLELSVAIPLNTVINCQVGILVGNDYEMLNYGNYVVTKVEKQEDTNTYIITCYDKLIYSMKKNEDLGISYPISIKNYLIAVANKIGLTVASGTFYNQDMNIPSELYLGLEYTYRDILDEIAQATGSIICLNENDQIQVKYPTQTNDTIDEEYLKNVNVKFGERYGAINTIVLSRAGESDNVYYPDPLPANPIEIKIVDNQIMNFNNRSDYLEGIYNALNGLYYYINDFTSTGVLYYDVGDLYNIQVGENTYQCLMLNDEVSVTTGIEELIHTDMPEQSETDYAKADKTDRRINQTYLIVDKQNQKIESMINTVTEQNNKISQITQTVDDLTAQISDIADITTYGESDRASVDLIDINESEPIMLKVHPTSTNISYLYPYEGLYPSNTLYMPDRKIRFTRTYQEDGVTKTQNIDYILPDDLLRYSDTVYDEFYLDYESQTCQVTKRCAYNADGTVSALGTEVVTSYTYPLIELGEGDYTVSILGYDNGYIYTRLMAKNIYTTQFYTKVETNSRIQAKADEINLGVNQTLTNYSTTNQMNSAINLKANEITSSVSEIYATKATTNSLSTRISQTAKTVEIAATDNQTSAGITIKLRNENGTEIDSKSANITMSGLVKFTDLSNSGSTTINGSNITTGTIDASRVSVTNLNASNITSGTLSANKISGGSLNLTGTNTTITSTNFSVSEDGNITAIGGTIGGFTIGLNSIEAEKDNYRVAIANVSDEYRNFLVVRTGTEGNYTYPFWVRGTGKMYAQNATITGTVNATSGTFNNITIKSNCTIEGTFDASKITSGTFESARIPNLSASKITSGTMSGNRISGGVISASKVSAMTVQGDVVAVNSPSGVFEARGYTGVTQEINLIGARLNFVGGILVSVT